MKNDLSTSTSTISKLESEKQKLEREKVSIQVELQDLNREKKLSEERESDYKLKLDNLGFFLFSKKIHTLLTIN